MLGACEKGDVRETTSVSAQASDISTSRSGTVLTQIPLSQNEIQRIQAGELFDIIGPDGLPYPSNGELIIICYDGIGSSPPDCFGIWGTNICSDPRLNCKPDMGCTCYEVD